MPAPSPELIVRLPAPLNPTAAPYRVHEFPALELISFDAVLRRELPREAPLLPPNPERLD